MTGHVAPQACLSKLYMGELSPGLLTAAVAPDSPGLTVEKLLVDEETRLPFPDHHLDIVLSNLRSILKK